jgi:arylsulfatase A-like enzyme
MMAGRTPHLDKLAAEGMPNKYLPTLQGFDEYFGWLYHLDASEDPAHPGYPQELLDTVGPRNMVRCWASDTDDQTGMPRWGTIGKQKIEDAGPLHPKRMETVDKATADGKPFFLWFNPSRMHVITRLSPKCEAMRNSKNGWSIQEAGMAQLDDNVGAIMRYLKDMGLDDNTIVMFTTDNGPETFTWPDGGMSPFHGAKGTGYGGGFRCPAMIRWPGKVPAGTVAKLAMTAIEFPPAQKGANFNLDAVKAKVAEAMARHGQ